MDTFRRSSKLGTKTFIFFTSMNLSGLVAGIIVFSNLCHLIAVIAFSVILLVNLYIAFHHICSSSRRMIKAGRYWILSTFGTLIYVLLGVLFMPNLVRVFGIHLSIHLMVIIIFLLAFISLFLEMRFKLIQKFILYASESLIPESRV